MFKAHGRPLRGPGPFCSGVAGAAGIRGDYVEARTADVFTGPCFSNAEVFIYGNQAVMAWKVTEGSWNGVDLGGLSVAAAVHGTTTFSEDQPDQARSVLIVDAEGQPLASARPWWRWPRPSAAAGWPTSSTSSRRRISLKVEAHSVADVDETHAAARDAAGPSRLVLGRRPGSDRDPSARRGRPLLRQRGRRLRPRSRRAWCVLPAYTLGHQFKGEGLDVEAGTTRTAAAASSVTSRFEANGRGSRPIRMTQWNAEGRPDPTIGPAVGVLS